ncbi:hypothetical protein F4694_004197 [Bacillus niacini]|uniref:Uncharacterized protein n=1 Tax=Neobacillus niacini TaxID=86668 RepID=A0A852TI25_9BACI|nr:hypothetical protein [Neobacillus niacini]
MGFQVVRFEKDHKEQWGVVSGEHILVLKNSYNSRQQL